MARVKWRITTTSGERKTHYWVQVVTWLKHSDGGVHGTCVIDRGSENFSQFGENTDGKEYILIFPINLIISSSLQFKLFL